MESQPREDSEQHVDAVEEENEADNEVEDLSLISQLPFEILTAILSQIAVDAPRTFVRTLLIGRELWIPYNSALLWEPICRRIYPELEAGEIHADDYGGFYELFRKRPAIRHNGVYICVSRYFRDGEINEGVISFYKPKHEVRYYRYLWLKENGTARSLLCNYPPKQVLGIGGGTPSNNVLHDAMDGHWNLDANTKIVNIVVDGGKRRKNDFHFQMEVASSGGKVHNKLKWQRYWCKEHGTENCADFSLSNEGSYYFHKLQ